MAQSLYRKFKHSILLKDKNVSSTVMKNREMIISRVRLEGGPWMGSSGLGNVCLTLALVTRSSFYSYYLNCTRIFYLLFRMCDRSLNKAWGQKLSYYHYFFVVLNYYCFFSYTHETIVGGFQQKFKPSHSLTYLNPSILRQSNDS